MPTQPSTPNSTEQTKEPLPVRDPGNNGPVVGGEHMPVPHARPDK